MQDWWEPRAPSGPSVVLAVPLADLPDVLAHAVDAVPGAAAMEIRDDGAVIARRTSFAARAENIVIRFERVDATHSRIRIVREGRDGLDFGQVPFVSPMARAVLHQARVQVGAPLDPSS